MRIQRRGLFIHRSHLHDKNVPIRKLRNEGASSSFACVGECVLPKRATRWMLREKPHEPIFEGSCLSVHVQFASSTARNQSFSDHAKLFLCAHLNARRACVATYPTQNRCHTPTQLTAYRVARDSTARNGSHRSLSLSNHHSAMRCETFAVADPPSYSTQRHAQQ
jgi:hypothetical protein